MKFNVIRADFDRAEFLEKYWQKEPVIIRQLIPEFTDLISPEELAGCACEELVESRVITEFTPDDYQLQNGPFTEKDFTGLPEENWTLLVQAMDQWFEEIANLREQFNFVPSWRVDDVMISFASNNAGVGPHFDNYDVFLLQGMGRRRWRVGQRCDDATALRDSSQVKLLQDFIQSAEYELEAGDALYIPPRVAHWGTSLGDSLCYSIGFRAPSYGEMLEGFSDFLIRSSKSEDRFEDPSPHIPADVNEIDSHSLDLSFQAIKSQLEQPLLFKQWFGCHVTQAKYPELIEPLDEESLEVLEAALEDASSVSHHPSSRFAYMSVDEQQLLLFVDGNAALFDQSLSGMLKRLCKSTAISGDELDEFLNIPTIRELLLKLLTEGSLIID